MCDGLYLAYEYSAGSDPVIVPYKVIYYLLPYML